MGRLVLPYWKSNHEFSRTQSVSKKDFPYLNKIFWCLLVNETIYHKELSGVRIQNILPDPFTYMFGLSLYTCGCLSLNVSTWSGVTFTA
jgi:hypothetical protein